MPEPIATLTGVGFRRRGRSILRDVSLALHRRQMVAVIGPNGGGKTTLLALLAGLLVPDQGEVLVDGSQAHRAARAQAGSVGLITAQPGLYPLLTGWENLSFFGGLYGLSPAEVNDRVHVVLERLSLGSFMDQPVGQGSSGTQQKLSLARALLMRPPLLLLDEPTAHLDPFAARAILQTLRAYADEGHGVLWVTHDLHTASTLCDRALLISGGLRGDVNWDGDRALHQPPRLMSWWQDTLGPP